MGDYVLNIINESMNEKFNYLRDRCLEYSAEIKVYKSLLGEYLKEELKGDVESMLFASEHMYQECLTHIKEIQRFRGCQVSGPFWKWSKEFREKSTEKESKVQHEQK